MTINLTREDFEQAIKSGASVFEGNTIPDTGKPSGRYYRFIRVPLANGEHKVDALYGQRFYGTLEKKPVTFNQEIRFLCLVEDNIFDVWANLNSGVLITIETWNQDGERGYNSVKCYVPVCGGAFTMRQSTGFSRGSNYLSCFNIVHNTRDFPLHECLEFNDGSMDWHGDTPSLWHYGEGHDINYAKALAKIRKFADPDIGERFNMQLDESFAAYAKNGYTAD